MRNRGCLNMINKVAASQELGYAELTSATMDVHLSLEDFPFAPNIHECLNRKQFFGLSNGAGSVVVFDTSELKIFYLTENLEALNIVDAGDYKKFVDNIKLTVINHRTFLPAQLCVSHFKIKGLLK